MDMVQIWPQPYRTVGKIFCTVYGHIVTVVSVMVRCTSLLVHGSMSVRTMKKSLPRRIQTQRATSSLPKASTSQATKKPYTPYLPSSKGLLFLYQCIAPHLYQIDLQLKPGEYFLKRPAKDEAILSIKYKISQ